MVQFGAVADGAGITDDPELRWDQVPPEPEAEASL
jgi:hypothetical protein